MAAGTFVRKASVAGDSKRAGLQCFHLHFGARERWLLALRSATDGEKTPNEISYRTSFCVSVKYNSDSWLLCPACKR